MKVAKKSKPIHAIQLDRILLKWVRRANMWCKTIFLNGKQTQEWSSNKFNL